MMGCLLKLGSSFVSLSVDCFWRCLFPRQKLKLQNRRNSASKLACLSREPHRGQRPAKTPLPHGELQQRTSKTLAPNITRPDSDSLFAIRNSIEKRHSTLSRTWINAEFGS